MNYVCGCDIPTMPGFPHISYKKQCKGRPSERPYGGTNTKQQIAKPTVVQEEKTNNSKSIKYFIN